MNKSYLHFHHVLVLEKNMSFAAGAALKQAGLCWENDNATLLIEPSWNRCIVGVETFCGMFSTLAAEATCSDTLKEEKQMYPRRPAVVTDVNRACTLLVVAGVIQRFQPPATG